MNLNKYSKKELIQILECYDRYIIEFGDNRCDLDAYPVCLAEFLDNEYQDMLDESFLASRKWLSDYLDEQFDKESEEEGDE